MHANKDVCTALREIVWQFGPRGINGECCQGLGMPEVRALEILRRTENCPMRELAQGLGFTQGGATRIVDRLERTGFATRSRSRVDGRVCCVNITAAGTDRYVQIQEEQVERVAAILKTMDPCMRQVVSAALRAFSEHLNVSVDAAVSGTPSA